MIGWKYFPQKYFQFHYTSSAFLEGFERSAGGFRRYGLDFAVSVGVAVAVNVAVGDEVTVTVGVEVNVGVTVTVAVVVGGATVNVAVGAWELCRVMRGLIHRAKSSWDEPFARTEKMNLTLSPFSVLRSMLIG